MLTRQRFAAPGAVLALVVALAGCGTARDDALSVVATTELIADLVANVGGDRVTIDTVVPPGGDPHSYEPSPADARKVAEADIAFTNHLLLEEHSLIKLFDANVPDDAPNISLAENAEAYGATLIPLVENITLDVIWLGLAVRGDGPDRAADVRIRAADVDGPGAFAMYLTDALGTPRVHFDTSDGLDADDEIVLPPDAHTHVNWAFGEPGVYTVTLDAELVHDGRSDPIGSGTFRFAVGVDPVDVDPDAAVLDSGHTDLAVDLDTGDVFARTDEQGDIAASDVIVDVPDRAIEEIPDTEQFAFLGEPGDEIHQLPQAVLGKHVHGEIDPHLWQNVANAIAYVHVITDTLIGEDPSGRAKYEANRDAYLVELARLDDEVAATIAEIPADRRQLITTHDAFGYLADAYGLTVAGFVVPNPAAEPSAAQVRELTETVERLDVPAVFVEPNLKARANVLRQIAEDHGVAVCELHGDALPQDTPTYIDMMRHNASELHRCLGE